MELFGFIADSLCFDAGVLGLIVADLALRVRSLEIVDLLWAQPLE
jgi:hypothetical protein